MVKQLSEGYLQRFGGIARLYGRDALEALAQAHFVVIGLGGVGTWAAEALARSGVGELTLIELVDVCVTNTNSQLHALRPNIGQSKKQIVNMGLHDINPEIIIYSVEDFLDQDNLSTLIGQQHQVVIDAIGSAHIKAPLVADCLALEKRLVTIGSSGGKRDPQLIKVDDLERTVADPILTKVRTQL